MADSATDHDLIAPEPRPGCGRRSRVPGRLARLRPGVRPPLPRRRRPSSSSSCGRTNGSSPSDSPTPSAVPRSPSSTRRRSPRRSVRRPRGCSTSPTPRRTRWFRGRRRVPPTSSPRRRRRPTSSGVGRGRSRRDRQRGTGRGERDDRRRQRGLPGDDRRVARGSSAHPVGPRRAPEGLLLPDRAAASREGHAGVGGRPRGRHDRRGPGRVSTARRRTRVWPPRSPGVRRNSNRRPPAPASSSTSRPRNRPARRPATGRNPAPMISSTSTVDGVPGNRPGRAAPRSPRAVTSMRRMPRRPTSRGPRSSTNCSPGSARRPPPPRRRRRTRNRWPADPSRSTPPSTRPTRSRRCRGVRARARDGRCAGPGGAARRRRRRGAERASAAARRARRGSAR